MAVAVIGLTATSASALELHGYLRSGIGGNAKGGAQQCFQAPNTDFKFRLGNECENYAEMEFVETVYKDKSGVQFVYHSQLALKAYRRDRPERDLEMELDLVRRVDPEAAERIEAAVEPAKP